MNLNLNFDGDTKLKDWWKTVKSNFQNIKSDFENEVSTRANADSELKNVIDAETAARLKTDNELNSAINNETSSRKTADNELNSAINSEISSRKTADNELNSAINSEISSRKTADNELSSAIYTEKNARISENCNILNIISRMYHYENVVHISSLSIIANEYYIFPNYIPLNTFFFIINDTYDIITEFRYSDMASIKLSIPIPPDEIPRLCILTKRETVSVDLNEDGYIFVIDDTQVSLTTKAYAAPKRHRSSSDSYGMGSATYYGHVKLSDSVSSTRGESGGIAATPSAVKQAYDLANTAKEKGDTNYNAISGIWADINNIETALSQINYTAGNNRVTISQLSKYGSYYIFPDDIPLNSIFTIFNDTEDTISYFNKHDDYCTRLSKSIHAGESRLCVLVSKETGGADCEDGYIFVLDDSELKSALDNKAEWNHTHKSSDITDRDTKPTSGSNNLITSGGVYSVLEKKLDNIPASGKEYNTGRVWLDGSQIYRRDFCIQVVNTSEEWEDKSIMWGYLGLAMEDFVVNSQVYGCGEYTSGTEVNINTVDGGKIYSSSNEIYWLNTPSGTDKFNIWGYVEYCKTERGTVSKDNLTHKFE